MPCGPREIEANALKKTVGHRLYVPRDPLASLVATDKDKLLERLESYARAEDKRVTQVMAQVAGEYQVVLVAGSDGRLGAGAATLAAPDEVQAVLTYAREHNLGKIVIGRRQRESFWRRGGRFAERLGRQGAGLDLIVVAEQ